MLFFDNYVRIGLIILQLDVKTRLVMLDQRVFKKEGIMLGIGDSIVNMVICNNRVDSEWMVLFY